ncbi:unnamed protein product [Dovyalis caffra]|uniref:Uncharacterized protein n=1 Tax=Dovyalis caffra TaxID=77055 RepID=A0AAV1RJ45_9ROSI|nr:unnamed protein product [Dovyalis caffra]
MTGFPFTNEILIFVQDQAVYRFCDAGAQRESHILGRPQEQKGKKRKNGGEHAKGFKKRKEGLTRDLKNLDKEISRLNRKISDQENLMDKLLNQLMPGSEELELLKEEFAILRPDPNWDTWTSETKNLPGSEELELLKEEFAILCPDPNRDVWMSSETKKPCDHKQLGVVFQ